MYQTLSKDNLEAEVLSKVEKGNQAVMRLCLDIAKDAFCGPPEAAELQRKVGAVAIDSEQSTEKCQIYLR